MSQNVIGKFPVSGGGEKARTGSHGAHRGIRTELRDGLGAGIAKGWIAGLVAHGHLHWEGRLSAGCLHSDSRLA